MAFSNHPLQIFTIVVLHLLVLTIQTHSSSTPPTTQLTNATAPVPASVVCQSTQYPSFCKSILQSHSPTSNVYDYGRFSFKRSISQATKFLNLVNTYLSRTRKLRLTPYTVRALQDCQYLAQANVDFLLTSFTAVNTTENKTLPLMTAEDVQTFLSGILTNQDTCLDEIRSAASAYGISSPLLNDTKLYSVALSLFTKAWIPQKFKRVRLRHGRVLESVIGGDVHINQSVTVRQDGSGDFTSINAAIAAAPSRTQASDGYYVIYVTAGFYEEYVSVPRKKRYIMMIGDGINQTIITGSRSVADNYTTFQSATFAVTGPGFVGINMTIQNTAGAINHQAVALRNDADLSAFYSCSFEGYQDTLYAHSLRQFYRDCDIYGTVDFIFGNANVVFQNCNIYPRLPLENEFNAITAQGRTDPNQNTGISIENCTIRATDDLANSNFTVRTFLGRPWKQYSRTVYMQSFMDNVIDPVGWNEWDGDFALDTLYYGEYDNSGPGSNVSQRVNWAGYHVMNANDASNFTVSTFVFGDEWLPQTGVPYASGLL